MAKFLLLDFLIFLHQVIRPFQPKDQPPNVRKNQKVEEKYVFEPPLTSSSLKFSSEKSSLID